MKRRFITQKTKSAVNSQKLSFKPIDVPDELKEYADRLRLLNDIPLTYLLADVSDLNEESIRFGIVDINWVDAYLDGAFSIGRVCGEDGYTDKLQIKCAAVSKHYFETPRMKRMHPNHKITFEKPLMKLNGEVEIIEEDFSDISVVLIRSELVRTNRGLNYLGYNKNEESLNILRIDKISEDIMICLFSGIIDKFIIEEPKTGLRFGCYDENRGCMDLRSMWDDKRLNDPLNISNYVKENGRVNAAALASAIEEKLKEKNALDKDKITPARFAYELMLVPHRAVFYSGKKTEGENE